ncbi:MAG TPA: sugar transferase [Gemmatimonadales bacterium]|nr:sugar transferase [Gemmatimonadales bacterium]
MTAVQRFAKRAFDLTLAGAGLVALSPVLAAVSLLIIAESGMPVLFRQVRIGRGFRPFQILKFRTMVADAARRGGALSVGRDPRITRVGRTLRRFKLDELPQLCNVLAGDMSLVGPRPEVPEYVERFRGEYEDILSIRPGMTDLASLKYRDESALLGRAADPAAEYVRVILPDKIRLGREYVARASMMFDLSIILRTIGAVTGVAREPRPQGGEPR